MADVNILRKSAVFAALLFFQPALAKTTIAILDTGLEQKHEQQISKIFNEHLHGCCDLVSFPIYDKNGDLPESRFLEQIDKASKQAQILHLSWNLPYDPKFDKIITKLNSLKIFVVAASGAPQGDSISALLKNTVMGKVKNAYLIGELTPDGRVPTRAFYGEPMLTAILPPKKLSGSSFSSVIFTAALARKMASGVSPEHLREQISKRDKSRTKTFPTHQDFLD